MPALAGWLFGWHCVRDADVFWHLTLGRAVLRHGSRNVPEPIAHPAWTEPCLAKDWLWDVLCYGLYRLGGMQLVTMLPAVFGAVIGYRAARLLETTGRTSPAPAQTGLAIMAIAATGEVLDVRPTLVFLTCVLLASELTLRFAAAEVRRTRLQLGAALVVMQLFWAQLHSSYALGPVLFVALVVEAWLLGTARGLATRESARGAAVVLLGMLLALLSSASGLGTLDLVARHAGGDAARHIQDMRKFEWEHLSLTWCPTLAVALSVVLGVGGIIATDRRAASGSSLALLGLLMTANNARFVYTWAVFCLPWAGAGLHALASVAGSRARQLALGCMLVSVFAVALSAQRLSEMSWPWFRFGLRPGDFPEAAARYLDRLPRGSTVFTEYTYGAPIGFWLDGKVRTFVDARTLLYFDDTDWAIGRDLLQDRNNAARAFERYGFRAAVVSRTSTLCPILEEVWQPVVVEPGITTFVPRATGAQAASGLAPCGRIYLQRDACHDAGRALFQTVAQQRQILDTPFVRLMQAAAQLECRRGVPDPRALPREQDSATSREAWRLYTAWTLLAAGRGAEALDVVRAGLAAGDPLSARILLEPEAGTLQLAAARPVLEQALFVMDDNAPPALRARLALICQASGDVECVRFQGLRAWLAGDHSVRAALAWASQHHPSARVRADLQAWLRLP